jgi:uncharacterized protein YidB (DUF937 family)
MGLFDSVLNEVLGGSGPQQTKQSTSLVEGLLEMLDDPDGNGLDGLSSDFQRQGLGDVMSSWISTGQNRPITPEQLLGVLGQGRVSQLSQRAGISEAQGPSVLAALLPLLIDGLTPQGRAPQGGGQLLQLGLQLLRGMSAGGAAPGFGAQPMRPGFAAPPAPPQRRADFGNVSSGSSTSATPPVSASPPAARTYTVVAGDSLSKIAKRYYGDANAWRRIFEANRSLVKDPDKIHPGQVLRIPEE